MNRKFTTVTIDEKDSIEIAIAKTIDEWCDLNNVNKFMTGYLAAVFVESKCYEKLRELTKKI